MSKHTTMTYHVRLQLDTYDAYYHNYVFIYSESTVAQS